MPISEAAVYAPWSVVVVPFPYADRLAEKHRPALVVSGSALAPFGLIWLAMITSAANRGWDCDVIIADLAQTGLPAPSVVRPVKIACVDLRRIVRLSGQLSRRDARSVSKALMSFFA